MIDIGVFVAGFASGAMIGPFFGWWTFIRLSRRLSRHRELENASDQLEKRREAATSGRHHAVAADAGPAVVQSNLFAVRPGKLELNRRREKREMLLKALAERGISTTLNESGSEQSDEGK